MEIGDHPVPAKSNPLGTKGCGEAGCAGSLSTLVNAVLDALSEYGIAHIDMPLTPSGSGARSGMPRRRWREARTSSPGSPAKRTTVIARRSRPKDGVASARL